LLSKTALQRLHEHLASEPATMLLHKKVRGSRSIIKNSGARAAIGDVRSGLLAFSRLAFADRWISVFQSEAL